MRLLVLAVGKIKEPGLRAVIDEYFDRVRRHYSIDEVELREAPPSQQVQSFEKHIQQAAHIVALDAKGAARTSEDFARWLGQKLAQGKGSVAFLLGGAEGLPAPILERAHETLSLSPMTFSHRLARLVLAEQLYRATAILHHEPYARL
jgi:23S rRNA (pseudouridine1915-N3)-methyltransferase